MEPNIEEQSLKNILQKVKEYTILIKKNILLILIFGILGVAIGIAEAIFTPKKYNAALSMVVQGGSSGGGYAGIASSFGINIGGGESSIFSEDNITELFKSQKMLRKTLLNTVIINNKKQRLANVWLEQYAPAFIEKNNGKPFYNSDEGLSRLQDSVLRIIYKGLLTKNINIQKKDKKLNLIEVTCVSKNEKFSKAFVEMWVQNVSEFYNETKTKKSRNQVSMIQFRVDSVKALMDQAMYGRAVFNDQNLFLVNQKAGITRMKTERDLQVLAEVYGEMLKNLEIARLTLIRDEPLVQIIDAPVYPLEIIKLGKVKTGMTGGFLGGIIAIVFILLRHLYLQNKHLFSL